MFEDFPQFVPQEVCLSCQGCCRFLTPDSNWRPKGFNGQNNNMDGDTQGRIETKKNGSIFCCKFLEVKSNTCSVYACRPLECCIYPFLIERRNKAIVLTVHWACPYIQQKRHTKDFDIYKKAIEEFFKRKNVLEFVKGNECLIEDYSSYKDETEELFFL